MRVLGIVGWSGSGKTTLLTRLIPLLRARGLTVSTVKHTHHGFDMDRPGKDTYRHREAGAHEVLVASGTRWALLHEVVGPEPGLPELLTHMHPVDLVLVEGYKGHPFPKLEVHRPALGKPPIWPEQRGSRPSVGTLRPRSQGRLQNAAPLMGGRVLTRARRSGDARYRPVVGATHNSVTARLAVFW